MSDQPVVKDEQFYRDAIMYNDAIANAAARIQRKVKNPEIKRWAEAVRKQHHDHGKVHRKILRRLKRQNKSFQAPRPRSVADEQRDFAEIKNQETMV